MQALGNIGFVTPLETAQLHVRVDETRETRGNATTLLRFVALDHGTETHRLLIDAAPAEHRWVQNVLERWLKS